MWSLLGCSYGDLIVSTKDARLDAKIRNKISANNLFTCTRKHNTHTKLATVKLRLFQTVLYFKC